jgi:tRNA(Ile)-lysidine synthase
VLTFAARVEQAIEQRTPLQPESPVLVAVSGGLDSMVLLRVMHTLSTARAWRLTVAHFDHRLRGEASRADARFVGRVAASLDLEFIHESADVAGFAREAQLSVEMAARILRHRFLVRTARAAGGATVALAHHADDQVELFFLRLFRGAGAEGLAGMNWVGPSPEDGSIRLIRPLLEERREALAQYAREEGIRFREDSSNRNLDIPRNRIRQVLLPLLRRQYQVALDPVILRTMATLRDDAAFIAQQAEAWRGAKRRAPFARLPTALQRHLLSIQLRELKVPVGFELVERLRLRAGERVSAGVGVFVSRERAGRLVMTTEPAFLTEQLAVEVEGRGGRARFGELDLSWRMIAVRRQGGARGARRSRMEVFDADKIGRSIFLRHWRPGDRFQPSGLPRAAKLQNLFVNERIPRETRHRLVVATTSEGNIFWVEGLRIAEGFKLDKKSQRGLKWSWHRTEPRAKGLVAQGRPPW